MEQGGGGRGGGGLAWVVVFILLSISLVHPPSPLPPPPPLCIHTHTFSLFMLRRAGHAKRHNCRAIHLANTLKSSLNKTRFSAPFRRLDARYRTTVLLHTVEAILCTAAFLALTYLYCWMLFGPLRSVEDLKTLDLALYSLCFIWCPTMYIIEMAMRFKV